MLVVTIFNMVQLYLY